MTRSDALCQGSGWRTESLIKETVYCYITGAGTGAVHQITGQVLLANTADRAPRVISTSVM